ncbi:CBO0543 family protein [Pseudalkalibacillus sp. A8]|uniref:CBO0543 family protein n=1 Tax=Pseudalkalibacillus sp. A8 TaxID=3382641 RepID=UPI0038B4F268
MERLMLRVLFALCITSLPFLFRKPNLKTWIIVFFSKGVLSTLVDNYVVNTGRVKYPVRVFPNIFKTNILYDLLFFPLLSIIWVQITYNAKPLTILLRSLYFSIPMSIMQWLLEKFTRLFKWRNWTALHTFISVNFTLFTIRGLVALIKRFETVSSQKEKCASE